MKNLNIIGLSILLTIACKKEEVKNIEIQPDTSREKTEAQIYTKKQKEIIEKYIYNCADTYNYRYEHHQYQECLDKGINQDPNISYLWQQKAMPYFKARKYEVGMQYLDKAVALNKVRYLAYRGFINCIFAKDYEAALADFTEIKSLVGHSYEMDHSYDFYIGLSHLQLNHFKKAEKFLKNAINYRTSEWGEDEYHHLTLFYLGISQYEQKKWKLAINSFDKALEKYPLFSDVMYYKSICLHQLDRNEESKKWYIKAKKNGMAGNTVNEDNSIYEPYPYKIIWH